MHAVKPRLSVLQIVEMNIGFFGLQFSFGLQQSNMSPIYSYLGATEAVIPLLSLAGPITGLLVQPLIGVLSDRTTSRWGRRTPYFLAGAILCSLSLLAMPYSPTLWVAASLLWVLDAANNVTMEPYRAYISDRLTPAQRPAGFLTQSSFTGLGQTLSYLAPGIMVALGVDRNLVDAHHIPIITKIAFGIGAVLSITTILWSIRRVPELPLSEAERAAMRRQRTGFGGALAEIGVAIAQMPRPMRQLAAMSLPQWYAMFLYWQYIALAFGRSLFHTADPTSPGYRDAVLINGAMGGFYNFVAFLAAIAMAPLTRRWGPQTLHGACLFASGLAMLALPHMTDRGWLLVPMAGIGLGWASIMGNPYVMLADAIPPARTGVYMGIFNMFIVIPMLLEGVTVPLFYHAWLGGDPRRAIMLAGVLLIIAAIAAQRVRAAEPDGSARP